MGRFDKAERIKLPLFIGIKCGQRKHGRLPRSEWETGWLIHGR